MAVPLPLEASPALCWLATLGGACVGSLLAVVVWRLPRQRPPLAAAVCPRCGARLSWFELVPLLSWLLQRGRCRHCHGRVALRYPLVELLCAGLWVAMLSARPDGLGPAPPPILVVAAGWLLVSWLIPLVLIDLDSFWLPEPLCRWGLLLGLAASTVIGLAQDPPTARGVLLDHVLAAGLGLLGFEAVSTLAGRLLGRAALGLGDAKLAALMGAWLGPAGLGLAVVAAVFAGALVGGAARLLGRIGRRQPIPFGPFLAFGAVLVWWTGHGPWLAMLSPGL